MSVSLTEERDRIQRQVEKLEQILSVTNTDLQLLSSDTDNESNSDKETEADILAQREKIQKEIQNLESVLGPHSLSCVSDDESSSSTSDDSELGLSLSVESCLQMNLVYQQVLQETLSKLETLLTHNQKQQKEVICQMSGQSKEPKERVRSSCPSSYELPVTMYLGRFLKPYFKDKLTGLGPPANQETRDKASKLTGFPDDDRMKTKRWESWQKKLIFHAVSRDTMMKLIQPKLSRVEFLSKKITSTTDEMEKQQIRNQIDHLEKEIDGFRNMKKEDLMGGRLDEHDWQKICNVDFEGTKSADDIKFFWQNFLHPSINKSTWSKKEVAQLREVSSKHGARHWDVIAEEVGMGRTAFMCLQTYQRFVSKTVKRSKWTPDEDNQLRELVEKMRIGNFIPYTQISYFMEGREPSQLIYRWNHVLDPTLRKGHWTKEEDRLLLQAVARHGEKNWWKIKLEVPGRTDTSCRDRYYDTLKSGTKRGAFSEEEKELLRTLVQKHGVGRWAKIASEIPNRIDAQCMRAWRNINKANKPAKRKKVETDTDVETLTDESTAESTEEEEDTEEEEEDTEEEEENSASHPDKEKDYVHTIPPMKEWIPVTKKENKSLSSEFLLNSCRVVLPSSADTGTKVRSTIVCKFGCSVFIGPSPRKLRGDEVVTENTMLMVSYKQLQDYLYHKLTRVNRHRSTKKPGRVTTSNVGLHLQAAVAPWIGNLLIPESNLEKGFDRLRELGGKSQVSSTSIFVFMLLVMKVDTSGCKAVIQQRRFGVGPSSKTVAGILEQRRTANRMFEQQQRSSLNALQTVKPVQTLQHQILQPLQQFPVILPASNVLQTCPGKPPEMSPVFVSQPFFITNPVLQPPQRAASVKQNIPTYFLNASSVPPSRLLLHVPPIAQTLMPPSVTPSSVSVQPQSLPINPTLKLVQPSVPNQAVLLWSTPSQPSQTSEVSNMTPPAGSAKKNMDSQQADQVQKYKSTDSTSSTSNFTNVLLDHDYAVPSIKDHGVTVDSCNQHKERKREREEKKDRGTNVQGGKNPNGTREANRSEVMPQKRMRKPSLKVKEMKETRDAVKYKSTDSTSSTSNFTNVLLDHDYVNPSIKDHGVTVDSCNQHKERKREREEEKDGGTNAQHDKNPNGAGEVMPQKRIRKPSLKVKEMKETRDAVAEVTKKKVACSQKSKVGKVTTKKVVQQTQTPPLGPSPSTSVVTPGGHVLQAHSQLQSPLLVVTPNPPTIPAAHRLLPRRILPRQELLPGQRPLAPQPPLVSVNPRRFIPICPAVPKTFSSGPLPQTFILQPIPNPGLLNPPPTLLSEASQPIGGVVRPDTPSHPPAPASSSKPCQFDPSLMFLESQEVVKDWLSGKGGVSAPEVGVAVPYLPPFVSNLRMLSALLCAKKSLTESALQLLGEDQQTGTQTHSRPETSTNQTCSPVPSDLPDTPATTMLSVDDNASAAPSVNTDLQGAKKEGVEVSEEEEEKLLAEVSKLVTNGFSENPAYQMLKARFLSCFTVPALLATIQPMTCEEREENEEYDEQEEMFKKMKERSRQRRAQKSLLVCEESGNPAH